MEILKWKKGFIPPSEPITPVLSGSTLPIRFMTGDTTCFNMF